jgi:hypothetical protein
LKILDPSNTTHLITVTPRVEPTTLIVLEFTNKNTKVVEEIENTYTYISGVLSVTFDLDVLESEQYSIEIRQNSHVIFRGLAFCTEQEPQDYKLTKDKYTYV